MLTNTMIKYLSSCGVKLDGVYHCPHHPNGSVPELSLDCDCRKPAPGMIEQAARELALSLPNSILIGDKPSDINAGKAAGVGLTFSVDSDNVESISDDSCADAHFSNLLACARHVLTVISDSNT